MTSGSNVDCCRSGGQIPASRCGAFERLGTDAAQITVTAGPVVERFNIVEHIGPDDIPGFVDAFADAFFFQIAERPPSPLHP